MCWMAAIPIAMAGAQAIGGQYSANKALEAETKAKRLQNREMLKQMNIQNADLTLQQRSELEAATSELTSQNMQRVQAMGSIRAAIGESMLEGASMERVKRVSEGDFIREANMVTENYRRNYAALFAQQLGATESTRAQIEYNQKTEGKGRSKLAQILDPLAVMGSSAAGAYASGAFDKKGGSSRKAAPITNLTKP